MTLLLGLVLLALGAAGALALVVGICRVAAIADQQELDTISDHNPKRI